MRRPPLPAGAPLLSPFLVWRVFFVSGLFAAGALAVFFRNAARADHRRNGHIAVGVVFMLILEVEKLLLRRARIFTDQPGTTNLVETPAGGAQP